MHCLNYYLYNIIVFLPISIKNNNDAKNNSISDFINHKSLVRISEF